MEGLRRGGVCAVREGEEKAEREVCIDGMEGLGRGGSVGVANGWCAAGRVGKLHSPVDRV